MQDLKDMLLKAPEGQLDVSMKPLIEKWSNPVRAIQILEVLDHCTYAALASGFTMRLLHLLYDSALEAEETTHADIVILATWRADHV